MHRPPSLRSVKERWEGGGRSYRMGRPPRSKSAPLAEQGGRWMHPPLLRWGDAAGWRGGEGGTPEKTKPKFGARPSKNKNNPNLSLPPPPPPSPQRPPPRGPYPLSWGPPPHSHPRLSLRRRRDASPPPLRPLSTFFFSIFNWKKKGGPRSISLLLGGARYARPPQQKEEGGSVPPRRGGDARGGLRPPSRCVAAGWLLCWGGPHENPWRPPYGASKGARGGFASLDEVKGREWGEMQSPAPLPPPPCIPPPFQKMGRGDARGGGGGRGRRQRPRLSSTDERCIPSYRGGRWKLCGSLPPPATVVFL
nr:hypothetical protein [Morchella crassipes]